MNKRRGFTLIELLVVISIITLLSSIVFASLSSARARGKDAAIKESVNQLRLLIEQNFNDYGSYVNLHPGNTYGWFTTAASCTAGMPAGNYQAQAISICTNIVNNAGPSTNFCASTGGGSLYMGNGTSTSTSYSVMAYLPYKTTMFCVGSSGANSDTTTPANIWGQPGCFSSP